jgi:hypothetical protein
VNWGHVTYHVTIVEGRDAFNAYRTLSWRWQRSPRLTENASIKFTVDRNQLTLIDDDGREFKMEIGKKRLNTPAEQLEECRNSVIDLHQQFPTPDALGDGLKQLSAHDLYNTFISNLQCSNVSMELQDFGLVTQFEAIRLAMLAARTDQGQVAEAPASQVEDKVCQQTISSVEASPMTPLTTDQLSENARTLYRCAMADYQKGGDKWFLRTGLARQKILTEIVARQANAGIGEHFTDAKQEKPVPASATSPVTPSAAAMLKEPVRSVPSQATSFTVATSPDQPNTSSRTSPTTGGSEGIASITSTPDGAEIFVDSVGHGQTPALVKLPPGTRKVQLVMHGYRDWVSEIEVKAGSIVNVTGNLEK